MIVVIGSPSILPADPGGRSTAAGRAIDVARGATDGGSAVQLVGKIGDDPAGDALLLALADAGIGHVAVLRDPARATPVAALPPTEIESIGFDDELPVEDGHASPAGPGVGPVPTIDGGDLDLALSYLPDHRVVVVAEPLDADALAVVTADCAYVGAALLIVIEPDAGSPDVPPHATALEAPRSDPDGIFGQTVGRFAAALDQGVPGPEALAQATIAAGWQPATA